MDNKDMNTLLLAGGLGLAAYFMYPSISSAAGIGTDDTAISVAGRADIKSVNLVDISGADWSVPLYLTMERDLALGFYGLDYLYTGASAVAGAVSTTASTLGNLLSTSLSTANSVARDIVVPAVINASGTVADVVATGAGYAWTGLKTAGSGIYYIGGKIYEGTKDLGITAWKAAKTAGGYVWNAIAGRWQYVKDLYKNSKLFQNVSNSLITLAAGATIKKSGSDTDNKSAPTSTESATIPLGYLSKTKFEDPLALTVTKMYNEVTKDTRLVTDNEAIDIAKNTGYKIVKNLGYCSPEPFKGCTQIFQLFNQTTLDTIVVTNTNVLPRLLKSGYESHGIIGYCKALS